MFRTNMKQSGSLYAILLRKDYELDEIKHEWGHNVQAMLMGIGNYGLTVCVMSPLALRQDKWGDYYNSPWEAGADYFGGVSHGTHTYTEISRAMWYQSLGMFFSHLTYFFLI